MEYPSALARLLHVPIGKIPKVGCCVDCMIWFAMVLIVPSPPPIKSGVFVNVVIKVSVNPWCLPSKLMHKYEVMKEVYFRLLVCGTVVDET